MNKIIVFWKEENDRKYHISEFVGYTPNDIINSLKSKKIHRAYFGLTTFHNNFQDFLRQSNQRMIARFRDGNLNTFSNERTDFPSRIRASSVYAEYRR